jgi:tetratricopeptide (TPR) repeat protein
MSFLERIFGRRAASAYRQGMRAFNACRYEEALECFRRALEAGAGSADPILGLSRFYAAEAATHLGRARLNESEPRQALRWLELAQGWSRNHPAVHYLAALAHAECGELRASASSLMLLHAIDPEHREAHLLRAAVLQALGAPGEAEAELRQVDQVGSVLSPLLRRVLEPFAAQQPQLAATLRNEVDARESTGV